jgi:hypothetical protein
VAATFAHLRAEARRRWLAWAAVVVLVGVVGGLVLGSLAGARRTHTAYDRMVERSEAWHVLVNPNEGMFSALDPEDVAALPQVQEIGTLAGGAAVLVAEGLQLGAGPLVLAAQDEHVLVDFARPHVVDGSLYDPSDPRQIMVDDVVAEAYDLSVGQDVEIATATIDQMMAWEEAGAEGDPPLVARPATVAGVVIPSDGIVVDEAFGYGHVYLTPAFAETHGVDPFFFGMAVRLRGGGADVPEFRDAVQALAPGEAIEFKTEAAVAETVARGTMPHTVALLLFAAVVGSAGFVVAGQAISRQLLPLRTDAFALRSVGVEPADLRVGALLRVGLLGVAGGLAAVAVAVAVSPMFPVGVADRAEIAPGFDADLTVLVPGAVVLVLGLVLWSVPTLRTLGRVEAISAPTRHPAWTERLATVVSSPIATTGLRSSFTSSGRAGSPRAAIAGLVLAVAAVAGTVTFGAGIDHLVTTPSTYGWDWDALATLPDEEWHVPGSLFEDRAADSPELTDWSVLTMDQVVLDGQRTPAVGVEYRAGDVGPTIVRGHRPDGPDEVVLGARTMDRLGVGIGDQVTAGRDGRRFEVVGQAVFAGLGTYPGADRTELGKGAMFNRGSMAEVGEGFGFASLVLRAADADGLRTALDRIFGDQAAAIDAEQIEVFQAPQRPADVQSLARVRSTPLVIAAVLATLGGAAFAFVLVSGVRARRREIALLKTFGFRRRDVTGTVVWQATATAVVAVAIGVPLGMIAGRVGWSILADVLGVGGSAALPADLLVVVVGAVLVANLIAVAPGLIAARTRPAAMLRSE